jgi:uncharacterized membrane protein YczE
MKNCTKKNVFAMVFGVLLIGIGVGFLSQSNFGVDPYSAMNYGISGIMGLSFGTWQLTLNMLLFIPMIFVGRKYIGLGSFANMIGVGYSAQLTTYILNALNFTHLNLMVRALFLVVGVCLICFGCALYTKANLGISPYDALAYIIEDAIHGKVKFRWIRIFTDTVCVIVALLTGGAIGVSTVIMMFFTGPLVQFFKDITEPIFTTKTVMVKKAY